MRHDHGAAGSLYLVVVAAVLSWSLWFITRQEISDTHTVTVSVQAVVEDANDLRAMVTKGREVRITVEGPVGDINALRLLESKTARAYVGEDDIAAGEGEGNVQVQLEDLQFEQLDQFENTHAIAMEPDKVHVRITRFVDREVNVLPPVIPDADFPGFVIDLEHVPAKVRVQGPKLRFKFADLATSINEDQLRNVVADMQDEAIRTQVIDLLPIKQDGTVYGPDVVLTERLVATVKITHVRKREVWVNLSILAPTGAAAVSGVFKFSNVNRVKKGDAFDPGGDGKPARLRVELQGATRALEQLPEEGLEAFVMAAELLDESGQPKEGARKVRTLELPAGVSLAGVYLLEIDVEN